MEFQADVEVHWDLARRFIMENDAFVHQWMAEGPGYFKHWFAIVFSRCLGQFGPFAFMCPTLDLANHRSEGHPQGVCSTHFVSKKLHLEPASAPGYYSTDKYACNLRLLFGKHKDPAKDAVIKGESPPQLPDEESKRPKAVVGNLKLWEREVESRDVWDLTYDDNTWADDEDEDGEARAAVDHSWLDKADPEQTYVTLCNATGRTIRKGEQIYCSYGRQSNLGLMLNYGFALADNPYNYVEVRQRGTNWRFYLKMDTLNRDLLSSLRSGTTVESNELLIVDRYAMLVLDHLKYLERHYSTEDDLELLRGGLDDYTTKRKVAEKVDPALKRHCITYRLERKKILQS